MNLVKLKRKIGYRLIGGAATAINDQRERISSLLYDKLGGEIAYGPFKGLKMVKRSGWGSATFAHKLFGLYERELLLSLIDTPKRYDTFVDIGSSDGYYAIGLLLGGQYRKAHCFEISPKGQAIIAENATLNGVRDNIEIYGGADGTLVRKLADKYVDLSRSVVLCDIEGAEFDLFSPDTLEALQKSIVFIELHPFNRADRDRCSETLRKNASRYFHVTELTTTERNLAPYKELDYLSDSDRWLICSEGRPERMIWLRLDPQTR